MQVTVVYNPTAGDEGPSVESLTSALADASHVVRWQSVKEDRWEDILSQPSDLVAVAGGDGTVRKVFRELADTSIPATLLPVGSANNIARSLGFDEGDPIHLIRGWIEGGRRTFDIGAVSAGEHKTRFVESAGAGIFADVLARAKQSDEHSGGEGKVERGLRLLLDVLTEAAPAAQQVELDGLDLSAQLLGVEAMNVRESGPNILLAPEADPGDELLDVVLIRPEHRAALQRYLQARLDRRTAEAPRLDVRRGRSVALSSSEEARLHVDEELVADERLEERCVIAGARHRVEILVQGRG
jgi:diacylglycerol kinase (ATP)